MLLSPAAAVVGGEVYGMYRKNRACRVSYGHVVKARKVMRSDPSSSSIPMWGVRESETTVSGRSLKYN